MQYKIQVAKLSRWDRFKWEFLSNRKRAKMTNKYLQRVDDTKSCTTITLDIRYNIKNDLSVYVCMDEKIANIHRALVDQLLGESIDIPNTLKQYIAYKKIRKNIRDALSPVNITFHIL